MHVDVIIQRGSWSTHIGNRAGETSKELAERVKSQLDADPDARALVNVVGAGAAVLDWLKEQGCKAARLPAPDPLPPS